VSKSILMTRRQVLARTGCVAFIPIFAHAAMAAAKYGQYKGRVVAQWVGPRNMRLTEPFEFIARDRRRWPVPSGTIVNGASIPRFLWSLIGSPFSGNYRSASVIHDHHCELRTRTSTDVHNMFWEAMRASGVAPRRAWLMHQAVAKFGPYWSDPNVLPECQIVDLDYDFNRCASNTLRPETHTPSQSKERIISFLEAVSDKSDPADIEKILRGLR
jgi:Protein of unknown function (DUF1353)